MQYVNEIELFKIYSYKFSATKSPKKLIDTIRFFLMIGLLVFVNVYLFGKIPVYDSLEYVAKCIFTYTIASGSHASR